MSEIRTTLKESASGELVTAVLHDELSLDDLFDAEADWAPARVRLLQRVKNAKLPTKYWPQSLHWNWARKAAALEPLRLSALGDSRLFGIRQDERWQGVLWAELCDSDNREHRCRLGSQGRPLVYVPFVEAAPWNWDVPPLPPDVGSVQARRFKGLGSQLMECAVRWSEQQELKGRVGLHALPQAELFYRRDCQMTDLGPDKAYGGLTYFEFTEEQAQKFLEGIK